MKLHLIKISFVIFLAGFAQTNFAQQIRSSNGKIIRDSVYWTTHTAHYVPDSIPHKPYRATRLKKTVPDPVTKRSTVATTMARGKGKIDPAHAKTTTVTVVSMVNKTDTTPRKKITYGTSKPRFESSKTTKTITEQKKLYTAQSRQLFQQHTRLFKSRLDSSRAQLFQQKIRKDSARVNEYLYKKKSVTQQCFTATVLSEKGYQKRILASEMPCNAGDSIFINNSYKNIIIKVVPALRVKVSGTILYREPKSATDPALLKNYDVTLQRQAGQVVLNIGSKKLISASAGDCDANLSADPLRSIIVEVPASTILVVQTRYASTNIENAITYLKADIDNGKLIMADANRADIVSRLGEVRTDNIKVANLKLENTKLIAGNISDLTIDSRISTLQLNQAAVMKINSSNDSYVIDQAGSVKGKKDFGKLTIETLEQGIELNGANADVKVNALGPLTPQIKISSKFADLKLPVYQLKNFTFSYEGTARDVNKTAASLPGTAGITSKGIGTINRINSRIEASAGDLSGAHARVDIDCPFCNVVFN